jgi:hypothetical protein
LNPFVSICSISTVKWLGLLPDGAIVVGLVLGVVVEGAVVGLVVGANDVVTGGVGIVAGADVSV